MRPKSKIYTPKRDDEHPRLFHMGVPPPGMLQVSCDKLLVFPSNLQVLPKKKAEIREGSSSLPCLACMGLLLGSKEYLGVMLL